MRIIQINCVYKNGSTGKIVYDLHLDFLSKKYESYVLYGRGKKTNDVNVFKISSEFEAKIHSVMSRLFGVDFGYSPIATSRTIKYIKRIKPDIVHLHCLNGHFINVYQLLEFLKKSNIKTVLTLHAEIMHTAGCEHAFECDKWKNGCYKCKLVKGKISHLFRDDAKYCYNRMKRALLNFDNLTIVGVSNWLTDRAKQSSIFKDKSFETVYNGLDSDVFCYTKGNLEFLKGNYESLLLYVTPNFNHPIKGGEYLIKLAKMMPKCKFLIIGFNGDKKILPDNVEGISRINNPKELAEFYSNCDLTILTSKRETFSMVVAESLSCGTPIVGFKAGGPEAISIPEYSCFVDFGNIEELKDKIIEFLAKDIDKLKISNEAKKVYSSQTMAKKYIDIYKK